MSLMTLFTQAHLSLQKMEIPNNMVPEDTPLQQVPEVMPEQDETEAIEAYIQGYSEEIAVLQETRRKLRGK